MHDYDDSRLFKKSNSDSFIYGGKKISLLQNKFQIMIKRILEKIINLPAALLSKKYMGTLRMDSNISWWRFLLQNTSAVKNNKAETRLVRKAPAVNAIAMYIFMLGSDVKNNSWDMDSLEPSNLLFSNSPCDLNKK